MCDKLVGLPFLVLLVRATPPSLPPPLDHAVIPVFLSVSAMSSRVAFPEYSYGLRFTCCVISVPFLFYTFSGLQQLWSLAHISFLVRLS